jgi:hypothetical protein
MMTRPAHKMVKISDEVCLFARGRSGQKCIQKADKLTLHSACQTLKHDTHPWRVMPKQVLFTARCFDSIPLQQVMGTWIETRTGGQLAHPRAGVGERP